jgi:hypothetical protein
MKVSKMTNRKQALAKIVDVEGEAVELPASAEKVDKDLVERAVNDLRELVAKTVARGQDEIGQYLLREFFEDDPEVYLASGHAKHASLRKLMDRCESMELPVSRTVLLNGLRLAAVAKQLPRSSMFAQLPPSHRVELLRVKAPERREKLATRAMESRLSVQKLRVLVAKVAVRDQEHPGQGRRPTPGMLKAIEGCLRLLRNEETGKLLFKKGDAKQMTEEQSARAEAALQVLEKRVADLRRILG